MIYKINKKGFVVLYASLVGGVVLAIGAAILGVTLKQITLSFAGRESHKAFYAADTALECAMRFDRYDRSLAPAPGCGDGIGTFGSTDNPTSCDVDTLTCAGLDVVYDTPTTDGSDVITNISIGNDNSTDPLCASVKVTKSDDATVFVARGLNTCRDTQNKFERAIRIEF
jgi:hypothetical protein